MFAAVFPSTRLKVEGAYPKKTFADVSPFDEQFFTGLEGKAHNRRPLSWLFAPYVSKLEHLLTRRFWLTLALPSRSGDRQDGERDQQAPGGA